MGKLYQQLAGRSLDRLCGLSDGLFSVAMTLLVFDLHVPVAASVKDEHDLWNALVALVPRLVPYLMSFLTLGIFWVGQQAQLNSFDRTDRDLTWIHIAFLCAISLMPFSTTLLASFITFKIALLIYWFNILMLGVILYAALTYANHAKLFKENVTDELFAGQKRRIVLAQTLYAIGAALCLINTYWSMGFIVLVQLNYAFAPRIPILDRL